jgi:hypothetical protein
MVTLQAQPLPIEWYVNYSLVVCIGFLLVFILLRIISKIELRRFQQSVKEGDKVRYAYRYYHRGKERKCWNIGTISTTQIILVSLRDNTSGVVRFVDRKDIKPAR